MRSRKSHLYQKIFIFTSIVIIGVTTFAFLNSDSSSAPNITSYNPGTKDAATEAPSSQIQTTNQASLSSALTDDIFFLGDNQIWHKNRNSPEIQITQIPTKVIKLVHEPGDKYIAYIVGESGLLENYGQQEIAKDVYIYDVEKKTHQKIYTQQPTLKFDKYEYVLRIYDIGKSADEELVAITTSDSVIIYNARTNNLNRVYYSPLSQPDGNMIYSHYDPKFSPDKTMILLKTGFYEGASDAVLDIQTGKLNALPYMIYGIGSEALGWFDNQTLLIQEIIDYDENKNSSLKTAPITNSEQLTTIMQFDGFITDAVIKLPYLYTAHRSYLPSSNADTSGYVYYDSYSNITVFNLREKTKLTLTTSKVDDVTPDAITNYFGGIKLSPDSRTLYISGGESINKDLQIREQAVDTIFQIKLRESAPLEKLIMKGTF